MGRIRPGVHRESIESPYWVQTDSLGYRSTSRRSSHGAARLLGTVGGHALPSAQSCCEAQGVCLQYTIQQRAHCFMMIISRITLKCKIHIQTLYAFGFVPWLVRSRTDSSACPDEVQTKSRRVPDGCRPMLAVSGAGQGCSAYAVGCVAPVQRVEETGNGAPRRSHTYEV